MRGEIMSTEQRQIILTEEENWWVANDENAHVD